MSGNEKISEKKVDFSQYGTDLGKMASREEIERPKRGSRTPTRWLTLESDVEKELRILPGDPEAEGEWKGMPYFRIFQHWAVGPSENDRSLCPKKMSSGTESCHICEQIEALRNTGDKADEQKAHKMRPSQSFIYQVVDRQDPVWLEGEEGIEDKPEMVGKPKIKILRLPWSAHSLLLDFYADPEYGDLSHPISGLDVKISKSGTGIDTTYSVKTKRNNSPLYDEGDGVPDVEMISKALELMSSLSTHPFFKMPTYDETVATFLGTDASEAHAKKEVPSQKVKGVLPAVLKEKTLESWIAKVTTEQPGQFPPKEMTKDEVARWGGWTVQTVEESVPCYGKEPDHKEQNCIDCPIKAPCATIYFRDNQRYSVSAPEPVKPKLEVGNGGTAGMKEFLKGAGAK